MLARIVFCRLMPKQQRNQQRLSITQKKEVIRRVAAHFEVKRQVIDFIISNKISLTRLRSTQHLKHLKNTPILTKYSILGSQT